MLPSWFDIRVWLHCHEAKDLTFCHQQGKSSRKGAQPKSRWSWKDAITPGRRQSKTPILSRNVDQKSLETEFVFDCHLSPHWQQMAIENTVSIDFWSAYVDCWQHFRLPPTRCGYSVYLFKTTTQGSVLKVLWQKPAETYVKVTCWRKKWKS